MIQKTTLQETSRETYDVTQHPTRVRSYAVSAMALLVTVFLLRFAQALLVPIVLSVLIAFALNPFVLLPASETARSQTNMRRGEG